MGCIFSSFAPPPPTPNPHSSFCGQSAETLGVFNQWMNDSAVTRPSYVFPTNHIVHCLIPPYIRAQHRYLHGAAVGCRRPCGIGTACSLYFAVTAGELNNIIYHLIIRENDLHKHLKRRGAKQTNNHDYCGKHCHCSGLHHTCKIVTDL